MNQVYLLTGGNMGNRQNYLSKAALAIEKNCGSVVRRSMLYETAAWGMEKQEPFLNQVLELHTKLGACELLSCLLSIEEGLGRKRKEKYGPRLIDIDILFFNDEIINTEGLEIPHPRMAQRRFVLEPLAELAPGKVHPVLKKTVSALLKSCNDPLAVNKFS
jgi:2-amino-4-hydroxy-6-hydroxymethyldihydropteridine diphosphokinase